ncbi:hypothetical protein PIB30_073434 [Stylosanthes scabra]|uniref:Uncharacterized protein n=1 Tax=Stylosanthes scabra TaxID=79078 RepID=A0ABU6UN73_9FABA|nr:hypothetical protein [Stylosanthes scabra]
MPICHDYHGDSKTQAFQHGIKFKSCAEDRKEAVLVQRPPPEPPDLKSLVVRIHNGAEDSAFAKGNVDADLEPAETEEELTIKGTEDVANLKRNGSAKEEEAAALTNRGGGGGNIDDGTTRSAEVGAFVKEKRRTIVAGVDATMTGGGLQSQGLCRVSPIVAKPPVLLAAVLPWDRAEAALTAKAAITTFMEEECATERKRRRSEGATLVATSTVLKRSERATPRASVAGRGDAPWKGASVDVVPLLLVGDLNERFWFREVALNLQHVRVEMVNPLQLGLGFEMIQAQSLSSWLIIGPNFT